ncbi:MAG: hypothetical protein SFV15_15485 [Polyangiaceae bacterium]|nr:hypothetical protein [Polyangiaceae bacterium]
MKNESIAKVDPPPLLGFNNNIRHKGRLFHIQTEDSGVRHARIMSHLFADGGRVIKSARIDYSEHIGTREFVPTVRGLMKEQHRSMFIALRAGEFDEAVISVCGPYPEPESETVPNSKRYVADASPTADPTPMAAPSRAPAPVRPPVPTHPPTPASRGPQPPREPAPKQPGRRPAATFGGMPGASSRSIFGDDPMSERSLDEVILGYLAEDLAEDP